MPNANPLLLAEGVDQETPISDQEKLNASKFTPTFLESTKEAAYSTTLDFMQQLTNLSAMDLPMFPNMFPKDMPRLSAEALNKQFGVNTFKDDMPEAQALLLVELQKQKNLAMDYSGLYSDSTFLGQNLPQWVGGIGGSMTNPLNAMPWGSALPSLGATTSKILGRLGVANPNVALKAANSGFVQSFVTNGMGSVIDAGVRKGLETRTGEELTWAQVIENVAAGTIIGTGFDTIGDLAASKTKRSDDTPKITKETPKAPTTPPEVEAGTIATAATRFEEGLPTATTKVRESFEPTYKEKLRIFTHEDIGEAIVAPDYHVLDLENGFVEVQKVDGSGYHVADKVFDTLEEANSYAFKNGEQVRVTILKDSPKPKDAIEVYHGTRETFPSKDLKPSRHGGFISLAEKKEQARQYALGGGGSRRKMTLANTSILDSEYLFKKHKIDISEVNVEDFKSLPDDAFIQEKNGRAISPDGDDLGPIKTVFEGASNWDNTLSEYLVLIPETARVITKSIDKSQMLDLVNNPANWKVFRAAARDTLEKFSKDVGNYSASRTSAIKHFLQKLVAAQTDSDFWSLTKLGSSEDLGTALNLFAKELEDRGFTGIYHNDEGSPTYAVTSKALQDINSSGTMDILIDPVDNDIVNAGKVNDVVKDFDNEIEKSGHSKQEVESFEKFEDTLVPSEEYKRMEDTFEQVKQNLDEEIRSSDTPDETLVAQKEKIVEFEAKAKSEESVIKALTHCILRNLK